MLSELDLSTQQGLNMDQFGIVYLLPEPVRKYHEELRLNIERKFNLTGRLTFNAPSHITMKYRFNAASIEAVEEIMLEFSQTQVKTAWTLQGFNFFSDPDPLVIFINVVSATETRTAHAHFLEKLRELTWMQWGPFDNASMHYHVTLANHGLTKENFGAVWDYVSQQPPPQFKLQLDNLALLKIESEVHHVYKQYQLRSPSD
jgi:2'-5' RNA ligase